MQKSGKVWIGDLKRRKKHDNCLIVRKDLFGLLWRATKMLSAMQMTVYFQFNIIVKFCF